MSRKEIENLLFDKLPDILTVEKKENRVKNLLSALRAQKKIKPSDGKRWVLDEL